MYVHIHFMKVLTLKFSTIRTKLEVAIKGKTSGQFLSVLQALLAEVERL